MRRTVRCALQLATERFGFWAGITLIDGEALRHADSRGGDDLAARRPRGHAREHSAVLDDMAHAAVRPLPVDDAVAAALAVPAMLEEAHGAALVTLPLSAGTAGRGVLAILTGAEPPLAELEQFASRVSRAITAAALHEERATLADALRRSLLPAELPAAPGLQLGGGYRAAQAATQIGGDFYDVVRLGTNRWALSIGDVCGKGVDAAVLTGQVRQSLRTAGLLTEEPAQVLAALNDTLLRTEGTTYVTVAYGLLEPAPGSLRVRLALGGHPPPLVLRGGGVSTLTATGTLIGMLEDVRFETAEVELGVDDVLLFYTDGLPEARGPAGFLEMLPVARTLSDSAGLPAQAIADRLLELVTDHLAGWPHDDIAVLAVRCVASGTGGAG